MYLRGLHSRVCARMFVVSKLLSKRWATVLTFWFEVSLSILSRCPYTIFIYV